LSEASNALTVSTNSTERMRIDSSGNVGIGVIPASGWSTSSYNVLDINTSSVAASSTTLAASLNAYNDGSAWRYKGTGVASQYYQASGNHVWQTASSGTAGTVISFSEAMRIDSSGNVGIGTSSPSQQLTVSNTGGGSSILIKTSNTSGGNLLFGDPESDTSGRVGYVHSTNYMYFHTSGAERMRIDSSGNVGIGTDSPLFNVDVDNADSNGTRIRIYNDARSGVANAAIGAYADDANGSRVAFGNNAFPTSQYNHNVSRPDSSRSAWAWSSYVLNSTYENQSAMTLQYVNASGTQSERMRIDSSGVLLVGKTSDTNVGQGQVLRANGETYHTITTGLNTLHVYSASGSAYRFYVGNDGTVHATNTSISAISDASLKENIRDLDKGLDTINALKPRRFDWKNGDGNDIMGFIAQEVEEVMPELIDEAQYNKDEIKKSLKMGDMIPSMVKAIQELSAQVTELKAEVAALKGA